MEIIGGEVKVNDQRWGIMQQHLQKFHRKRERTGCQVTEGRVTGAVGGNAYLL